MIHVYDKGNSAYDKNGNVILFPKSGTVRMAAGGNYELQMVCQMDAEERYKHLEVEAVVKAPVPKETITTAYSGMDVDVQKVDVSFCSKAGTILVCKDGAGVDFSEEIAKQMIGLLPKKSCKILFLEEEIKAGGMGMMLSNELSRYENMKNKQCILLATDDRFALQEKDEPIWKTVCVDAESIVQALI